jgi:hypothetical protein
MDAVLCSYCVVQKGERRGEYPGAPPHHLRKKEGRRRKKQLADRKVPDRPGVVKGESYKKKRIYIFLFSCTFGGGANLINIK